jgi:hypothetical protein
MNKRQQLLSSTAFASPDLTVEETMAFRKESRSTVERKMRNGAYVSYKSGNDTRLVTRESVEADRARCLALGPRFGESPIGGRGRPKKALAEAQEGPCAGRQGKSPPGTEDPPTTV